VHRHTANAANENTKTLTGFLSTHSTWGDAVDGNLGISEWNNLERDKSKLVNRGFNKLKKQMIKKTQQAATESSIVTN